MSELKDFAFLTHAKRGDMDFAPKFKGDLSSVSLTQQEFAEECDINTIMAQYERTGAWTHVNQSIPAYFDATALPDLRGRMELFEHASDAFMSLPAHVRKEFDNDAIKFIEAAQDPANLDKFREWGLAPAKPEAPKPVEVRVVADPVPPGGPASGPAPKA